MVPKVPEEIKKLRYIFRPYCDGARIRDDAPKEAIEAHNKYIEWFRKNEVDEKGQLI